MAIHVVAVWLAGWLPQRVSVAVQIRGENYVHEDPSRALLASEKELTTRMWVSRPSFLTCNVSCLGNPAPSVCLGLCSEQQIFPTLRKVFPMLKKIYLRFKALV